MCVLRCGKQASDQGPYGRRKSPTATVSTSRVEIREDPIFDQRLRREIPITDGGADIAPTPAYHSSQTKGETPFTQNTTEKEGNHPQKAENSNGTKTAPTKAAEDKH